MIRRFGWFVLAFILLVVIGGTVSGGRLGPMSQDELTGDIHIYAYRGWQSSGVSVAPGDLINIRARGSWLYTPNEYHGPEGHATYPAPAFYPLYQWPGLTAVPGGALIGRIGEKGDPFYVGKWARHRVQDEGFLYLRINDDVLSDNDGSVTVRIYVTSPTPQPR